MIVNAFIVDGFYNNPDEVREFALAQDFNIEGNYPGLRTKSFINPSAKETLESIICPHAGPITYWPENDYNGAFQITTAKERSWIHADEGTTWAGVVYLTPDAPTTGGTGFFRHKPTGYLKPSDGESREWDDHAQDVTKWEMMGSFANVYNRLVIYRGEQFHSSLDYFGTGLHDGRLFQTFFFTTEQ